MTAVGKIRHVQRKQLLINPNIHNLKRCLQASRLIFQSSFISDLEDTWKNDR